jgi:hypothetical protein
MVGRLEYFDASIVCTFFENTKVWQLVYEVGSSF